MDTSLTFGIGKDLITPAEPTTMIGFGRMFGVNFFDIHDDLYVRTLLIEDGAGERIIMIALDLLFHDDSLPNALRDYALEKHGVKRDNLHISYTHTHFGPAVKGYDVRWTSDSYEAFLFERICRSIDRAFLNKRKGYVQYSSVHGEWNISRRLFANGKMNFDANPDGECDKNIYLLKFCDEDGTMCALVMNFACHPSNLDVPYMSSISSEYPGRLCHRIESEFYGCTALFFQGFGADAKLRIGVKSSHFNGVNYDELDEVTQGMTLAIRNKLLRGDMETLPISLGSRVFQIELPLEIKPLSFYIQDSAQYSGELGKRYVPHRSDNLIDWREQMWSFADYTIEHYDSLPETVTLNCGVVQLNPDFYILSMGGEPGINIQTVLRESMPDKKLICFGYNDAIAYVPSDKMIREGGYEAEESITEYRLKGKIKEGVDELFITNYRAQMEAIRNENK